MLSEHLASPEEEAAFLDKSCIRIHSIANPSEFKTAFTASSTSTDTLFHRVMNKHKSVVYVTQAILITIMQRLVAIHGQVIVPVIICDDIQKLTLLMPKGSVALQFVILR